MCLRFSIYEGLKHLVWPLKLIDQHLPKHGQIIDLGCGEGVIAKYLAQESGRKIIGVDQNCERLPHTSVKNLEFRCSDIIDFSFKSASGAVLSDVLHHLDYQKQEKLLGNIFRGLKKGGSLIIKEIDAEEFIRCMLSRFWDLIFYPKDKIYYSSSKNFKKKLENVGFNVHVIRASRLFPGSTTLYIATK